MNGIQQPIVIRRLQSSDAAEADSIFRTAFALELGYEDPAEFSPGYSVQSRFTAEPDGIFGGYVDEQLVGVAFCSGFGSLGVFGPAAVKQEMWGRGIGQALLKHAIEYFSSQGITKLGLTTFPASAKHVSMYHKYGFYPRFLIASVRKPINENSEHDKASSYEKFSALSAATKDHCLEAASRVTGAIYEGLRFDKYIRAVDKLGIGDTLMVSDGDSLAGFALCHYGAGAEAEAGVCHVKLAAVRPGPAAANDFGALLKACIAFAKEKGAERLYLGINSARRKALEQMLSLGFRIESLTVSMHNPNEPFADRDGVYLVDDWR